MKNEKIKVDAIVIDGIDCSGKTTLWEKQSPSDFIQIRGMLSNIAYGLKYGRDINSMIEEYNTVPLNYVIFFIEPPMNVLVKRFGSRLLDLVGDNKDNGIIKKEVLDFADSMEDTKYFLEATEIIKEKYNGKIYFEFSDGKDTEDDFKTKVLNKYGVDKFDTLNKIKDSNIILLNVGIDGAESQMKRASEFKHVVFVDILNPEDVIQEIISKSDYYVKSMIDKYIDFKSEDYEYIYDEVKYSYGEVTEKTLTEWLENYEFEMEINVNVDVRTYTTIYARLGDIVDEEYLEDYISSEYSDQINEAIIDEVSYNSNLEISIEEVR